MTTSQLYQDWRCQQAKLSDCRAGFPEMEWQTPAVSDKVHSRFGRQPSVADSGDTGLGTTPSESMEDFCSSSGSPSFQPIRSQIPIPTAHVMPSTASGGAPKPQPGSATASSTSRESSSSSTKSSPLPKSVSSPNLEEQVRAAVATDCLSRYRSLVNGLDHSLLPPAVERSRLDDGQGFAAPTVEPTLNQSALLGSFCPDPRYRLQMTGLSGSPDAGAGSAYRLLPEARPVLHSAPQRLPETVAQDNEASRERPCSGSSWQQLESLRLEVEQMKLRAAGSGQLPPLYPSSLQAGGHTWDAVAKVNEGLLREKELIIERQKQQMVQLEQRLRESELQVHGAVLGRGAPYVDVCLLRLQEAQRENAFLRAQFAERSDAQTKEVAASERRLAAAEAEACKLGDTLRDTTQKHAEEKKKQEERIRSRDKHINSLKKKCQKECDVSRERQQRVETLERYLADLPTLEHYKAQSKQLEDAQEKTKQLQEAVAQLQAALEEAQGAVREKGRQLEEQRQREKELLTTVTSLQERVREGLEDGVRLPTLDVAKLRDENEALREEVQRLQKVVDKERRVIEQLGSQIRTLEKQLLQEEGTSQALREELCVKERSLLQQRSAMKELSGQNQELVEQTLTLQERLCKAETDGVGVVVGAVQARHLHAEMKACLGDLRSLCSVLTQRAQGRDPNLSLLLGVTPTQPGVEDVEEWSTPEALDRKLAEVQLLRRDVEELRTAISDRYAQDMGDNCITQ
ncbi:centrosomal protein of 85 kDa isoform X1 [Paramormyrops kingsleyae]|uniref:centrosomal protein of 85 kDa isoform X1 n=2 Tax=Paramormyrops kingsleyae TaxID=1676925 RepID=UPI003B979C43